MKNIGRYIKKGFMLKERITYGWGILVFKFFLYSVLMNKIEEFDMVDVILVREILCYDLLVD